MINSIEHEAMDKKSFLKRLKTNLIVDDWADVYQKEDQFFYKTITERIENLNQNELSEDHQLALRLDEISRKKFLQELFMSNVPNDRSLASLVNYMLHDTKLSESKYYCLGILPRVHDELSFYYCLLYSHMGYNQDINKIYSLSGYTSINDQQCFYEFKSPLFSNVVVNILDKKIAMSEAADAQPFTFHLDYVYMLVEYLTYCIEQETMRKSISNKILFKIFTRLTDHSVGPISVSIASTSDFDLIYLCLKYAIDSLVAINTWRDYESFDRIGSARSSWINSINSLLKGLNVLPGHDDEIENIYDIILKKNIFFDKDKLRISKLIEEGKRKQHRLKKGLTKFYKNPYLKYDSFQNTDERFLKPEINIISHYRLKDSGGKYDKEVFASLEDDLRVEFGLPKKGELWKSETDLYYMISKLFQETGITVYHHYRPKFLNGQELDIYFETGGKMIGIEYQGLQHFQPVSIFGGEEGYLRVVERDKIKKQLCKENGVNLLYINYNDNLSSKLIRRKLSTIKVYL